MKSSLFAGQTFRMAARPLCDRSLKRDMGSNSRAPRLKTAFARSPFRSRRSRCLRRIRKEQDRFRQQFGPDYRADLDLIFANPDGTPLRPDSISATVSALSRRLKLPKGASLHTLRHSHGSHLIASGMDLATVSARLGHSNVRVTAEIYAHVIRGRDDEAAQRWQDFQHQNSPEKRAGDVQ